MTRLKISPTDTYEKASNKQILEKVGEIVTGEIKRSTFFDATKEYTIPRFTVDEVIQGNVAGRGGFCVVRQLDEIRLVDPDNDDDDGRSSNGGSVVSSSGRRRHSSRKWFGFSASLLGGSSRLVQIDHRVESSNSREYLARRVWQQQGDCKYVVKQVDPNLLHTNKLLFLKGTIDLALETKYLASLCHPHIAALRGVCRKSASKGIGFFVILDNLPELLSNRLTAWMHQYRATRGITGFVTRGKKRALSLEMERLLVAYDIAGALNYLHVKNIIYRDLKPDNIGFDTDGVLKIFDFGLAKELIPDERTEDGLYNMTGMTGAVRYMAPEVALNEPYDLRADVYSWSMVFWYIMALEPPLGLYPPSVYVSRVAIDGVRPAIHKKWPSSVGHIMKEAWHEDIRQRPYFDEIMSRLRETIRCVDPGTGLVTGDSMNDTRTANSMESSKTEI